MSFTKRQFKTQQHKRGRLKDKNEDKHGGLSFIDIIKRTKEDKHKVDCRKTINKTQQLKIRCQLFRWANTGENRRQNRCIR